MVQSWIQLGLLTPFLLTPQSGGSLPDVDTDDDIVSYAQVQAL